MNKSKPKHSAHGLVLGIFLPWIVWWGMAEIPNLVWAGEETSVEAVRKAFEQGQYPKVIELAEPLLKKGNASAPQVQQWYVLALAHTSKTSEALDAYERLVQDNGREDEVLLKQMAIASILPLRADMREQMRGAAYTALREMEAIEAMPYLEEGLGDQSGMIRALVTEGMGHVAAGRQSKRFRDALKDGAALVRANVLEGMAESGDKKMIPIITPFLTDDQLIVQISAAKALLGLGQSQYWERLERGVRSEDGYERGASIRALGDLGDPRAVAILEQTIKDSQPSIRAAAVSALGKLQTPSALKAVKGAMFDHIPAVRSVAAFSLGNFPPSDVLPVLTSGLQDPNLGVQTAAVASLLRIGASFTTVAETVERLMQDQNPAARSGVAKALGHGTSQESMVMLKLLIQDPTPRPRITAARSLGRIGQRNSLPILKRTLRDTDEAVRVTAAAAIVRILEKPVGT